MKFIEVVKSHTGFHFSQKPHSLVQKCKLKIILDYDVIVMSQSPYDAPRRGSIVPSLMFALQAVLEELRQTELHFV